MKSFRWVQGMDGKCGAGSEEGTAPKREPMVATSRWKSCTTIVAATIATKGAGTIREMRGQKTRMSSEPQPTRAVVRSTVPKRSA